MLPSDLLDHLKLDHYLVKLRLCTPTQFHFFHGGAILGLLNRALWLYGGAEPFADNAQPPSDPDAKNLHPLPREIVPRLYDSGLTRYRKGDGYHFGLALFLDLRQHATILQAALERAGQARPKGAATLLGNFTLEQMELLEPPDLFRQWQRTLDHADLRLQFTAPLRLERPAKDKQRGPRRAGLPSGTYFDHQYFPLEPFLIRCWNRLKVASDPASPVFVEQPDLPTRAALEVCHLFEVDVPTKGRSRSRQPRRAGGKGGFLGDLLITGLNPLWKAVVVAAGHLHLGGGVHYGLGHFSVKEAQPSGLASGLPSNLPWGRPSRDIIATALTPPHLEDALAHTCRRSTAAGVDRVSPQAFNDQREHYLERLRAEMHAGTYKTDRLLGILLRKPNEKKVRALAIPTVRDRILQRAVAQQLVPALDTLMEDCSFGYRRNFSRHGAARAIQQAYAEGYRFVLDGDITAFFDQVDRDLVLSKLRSLFAWQTTLHPLVKNALDTDVELEGRRIARPRGLPQGSPLSPVLSNLLLDELDDELLALGFRLVRFADDFVVLCKTKEQVEEARQAAEKVLHRLGLDLHPEKTGVEDLESGFTYLGFLFCRSLALEKNRSFGPDTPLETNTPGTGPTPVSPGSWLSFLDSDRLEALDLAVIARNQTSATQSEPPPNVVPLLSDPKAPPSNTKSPLLLFHGEHRAYLKNGAAILTKDEDEASQRIPIADLSHVVIWGRPRISTPLALACVEADVPVFYCASNGRLRAVMEVHPPAWGLWMQQAAALKQTSEGSALEGSALGTPRLELAREIVDAKLHNQATVLVHFHLQSGRSAANKIRQLRRSLANKTSIDEVRGIEGKGAALFFGCFRKEFCDTLGFSGRVPRRPPDAVNVLLSFGYTVLHNLCAVELIRCGLNPRLGLYHVGRGTHQALASDLQEEFRHLVEAQVIAQLHRREITTEDFQVVGERGLRMLPKPRRAFLLEFERRITRLFTPKKGGPQCSYLDYIGVQARQLAAWISANPRPLYSAFRRHS